MTTDLARHDRGPVARPPLPGKKAAFNRAFLSNEDGAGTVFGIFLIVAVLLIGGVALDGTNLWRNHQMLQQTADVASHAGAVELARGNSPADARTAAAALVGSNLPADVHGNLFADQQRDIQAVRYDPATNTISSTGTPNAIAVTLHKSDASGNTVPTYMLRVADIMNIGEATDLSQWSVSATAVTAFLETARCSSTDGIYAKGTIESRANNSYGGGYCLHSQVKIWMPQRNSFGPGAGLSMPNLAACQNKCTDKANPGSEAAAFERNLLMPDLGNHIASVRAELLSPVTNQVQADFWGAKKMSNVQPLRDIGVMDSLFKGAVVDLTQAEFESLTAVPEGLTYNVTCSGGQSDLQFGSKNGGGGGNGGGGNGKSNKNKPSGNEAASSGGGTSILRNVAIVTNCGLSFGSDARVEGSVILTTAKRANGAISASSGASVGTLDASCEPDQHSVIYSKSKMHAPANFAGSNVTFVIDDDITLAASKEDHYGLSFMASGDIKIAANHTFNSCNTPPSGLMPSLSVIRHVVPNQVFTSPLSQ